MTKQTALITKTPPISRQPSSSSQRQKAFFQAECVMRWQMGGTSGGWVWRRSREGTWVALQQWSKSFGWSLGGSGGGGGRGLRFSSSREGGWREKMGILKDEEKEDKRLRFGDLTLHIIATTLSCSNSHTGWQSSLNQFLCINSYSFLFNNFIKCKFDRINYSFLLPSSLSFHSFYHIFLFNSGNLERYFKYI